MSRLRWRKLGRDLWVGRARIASMIVAIAVSVAAVAAFLTARAILGREITANYLAGHPASATLHLPGGVTPGDVRTASGLPGVTDAVARGSLLARVRVAGGPWQPLILFISAADDPRRVSTVAIEQGVWPPPARGLFLERTALPYLGVRVGQQVTVRAPGEPEITMTVTGSVHDPGVAPASQERTGYGRVTTGALTLLGRPARLDELELAIGDSRGPAGDAAAVTAVARQVGAALTAAGSPVSSIDVPPPLRHPHYGQMVTVGYVLLAFGLASLLLSSVLVATMLGGLLTAQIRQLGAMKAVGARNGQLLRMYLALVAGVSVAATALGAYPGLLLGRWFARIAGSLLNLDLGSQAVPGWVIGVVLATGVGVPLLVCLPPLLRGTRRTVREAIDDHGGDLAAATGRRLRRQGRSRLPRLGRTEAMALRGMLRRPWRLALTVGLLALAGATFLTGLNSAAGWDALVADGVRDRHYDLEVRLDGEAPADRLLSVARQVPGVRSAQAWGRLATATPVPGLIDVRHVYPDDAHGSLTLLAPPADTPLITLPVLAGRWLRPDDPDAVVLNAAARAGTVTTTGPAAARRPDGAEVGDDVWLSVDGRPKRWHVVGIVADFGSQGVGYVTDREFAAATGRPAAAGMLRVVTTAGDAAGRRQVLGRLVQALDAGGAPVEQAFSTDDLRSALDGHVFVLIEALVAISLVIALVGLLGLGSAMSTAVTERTREYGIMHALGAGPAAIRRIVVTEGLATAIAGLAVAMVAALPLTSWFGSFLGRSAFKQPLPLTVGAGPVLLWTVLTLAGAAAATAAAARRASRMTVREALDVS